jgi:hypothetical protein
VVDAGPAEAIDTLSLEFPPAGTCRHHDRASEYVLAVIEIDP